MGFLYILVGTIFLFVPIIYLELGRSKDLLKAFLNLLIGFILIIKNRTIDESFFVIFLLLTVLFVLYLVELFLSRWNQLTDKEANFTKPLNLLNFGSNNQNKNSKKWVRNDKNDKIKVSN